MNQETRKFEKYFISCSRGSSTSCNLRKKHKHCKLCYKSFDTPFHCKRHFEQSHVSRAVSNCGTPIYPCKRQHGDAGRSQRSHFHCPVCKGTVTHRTAFVKHLEKHHVMQVNQEEENYEPSEGCIDEKEYGVFGVSHDEEEESKDEREQEAAGQEDDEDEKLDEGQSYDFDEETLEMHEFNRSNISKKACPVCNKYMHPKSLARHCRDIHQLDVVSTATCVDEEGGLFVVRNSSHGGVGYPIHVRKVMCSKHGIQCELTDCMDYMRVAWKSGLKTAECKHLEEAGKNPAFPPEVELMSDAIKDLSPSGAYRMFTSERIEECIALKACADKNNSRCIVPIKESTRFIHFSVYDGNVHYYSRFGRVIATADMQRGTLDCRCCRRKRSCIHKCICLWYLRQDNLLDNFRSAGTESEEDCDIESGDRDESSSIESQSTYTHVLYPPDDRGILEAMCRYLQNEKRIPIRNNNPTIPDPVTCLRFVPLETTCHLCSTALSAPIRITNKAVIVTLNKFVDGVETYYKRCGKCGMCYRYQEVDSDIHNFNDTFLIGLDVCRFLRDSLQQHLPIGSIVKVLEGRLNRRLNA